MTTTPLSEDLPATAATVAVLPEEPEAQGPEARDDTTPELLTLAEAQAMGYTAEQIQELREAGVMEPEPDQVWREPETLEDLDALLWRRKRLRLAIAGIRALADQECEIIREQARVRTAPLIRAEEAYSRFDARFEEITRTSLPRRADGSYKTRSLQLPHATVGLKTQRRAVKIEDEAAALPALVELWLHDEDLPEEAKTALGEAVRATTTTVATGEDALVLAAGRAPDTAFKVFHAAVQKLLEALPPRQEVNGETGEVVAEYPATIPGVVIVPSSETWVWE